jgi:hypothetical protein
MLSRIIRPLPYQSCSSPGFLYRETSSHSTSQSLELLSKKTLADCVPVESSSCESSKMHKLHICILLKKPIVFLYGLIYAYLSVEDGERITLCAWRPVTLPVGRRHWRLRPRRVGRGPHSMEMVVVPHSTPPSPQPILLSILIPM